MIKILLVISLNFYALSYGFAQEFRIKGRIYHGQYFAPVGGVYVGFDTTNMEQTGMDGYFEIVANERQINDTLKIFFLSHNTIKIVNLPKDREIDLGNIPIYEYYFGVPMVYFDCGALDLACKRRQKKFWKDYDKERKTYFDKMDTIIGHYRMSLNGKLYKIETPNQLIDLGKPVEK